MEEHSNRNEKDITYDKIKNVQSLSRYEKFIYGDTGDTGDNITKIEKELPHQNVLPQSDHINTTEIPVDKEPDRIENKSTKKEIEKLEMLKRRNELEEKIRERGLSKNRILGEKAEITDLGLQAITSIASCHDGDTVMGGGFHFYLKGGLTTEWSRDSFGIFSEPTSSLDGWNVTSIEGGHLPIKVLRATAVCFDNP